MSEIRHQWNGTVLTVISDSGASSMDLAGPKGDTGCRGPQGPAGVLYGEDGEIVTNLTNYYTKEEIDNIIYGVGGDTDFSVYATKDYVLTEIEKAQLEDIEIDLSSYATKSYVDQAIAASGGGSGGGGSSVDLSNYYTKSEVDNKISNAKSALFTFNSATGRLDITL